MRAYVMTSGVIFGLLVVAHIVRMFVEGAHVFADPWYALATIVAAALCAWAFRVMPPRSPDRG